MLQSLGSRTCRLGSCSSQGLGHKLNSCGTWANLLHGMWDLPRPGIEPMSLALAGGFFTREALVNAFDLGFERSLLRAVCYARTHDLQKGGFRSGVRDEA